MPSYASTAPSAPAPALFQPFALTRDIARLPLFCRKIAGDTAPHLLLQNDNTLILTDGDIVSFDTYFNTFFERYLVTATNLKTVTLKIKVSGTGLIEVFRFIRGKIHRTLFLNRFDTGDVPCEISTTITLEKEHETGSRLSLHISGLGDGCTFHEAGWFTETVPLRSVALNTVICTFKKENYLDRVVHALLSLGVLKECNWRLFIVDNASEISSQKYNDPRVTIFAQKNAGGAGGFTRGIMEAVYANDKDAAKIETFIHLMDDDIELAPEIVFRTIKILEHTKGDVCLGGGMIDMNRATIMHEHGSDVGGNGSFIDVVSRFHNYDLANPDFFFTLSQSQKRVGYNAWWYFAFPAKAAEQFGLPMPCFIRGDDQEYGLRLTQNNFTLLTPPGIALWHEPFEAKHAGWTFYFGFYNNLIIGVTKKHETDIKRVAKEIKERFIIPFLQKKNYAWAAALISAVEDFLLGPDYFMTTEPQERMRRARSFDAQFGPEVLEQADGIQVAPTIKDYFLRDFWRKMDYGNRFHLLGSSVFLMGLSNLGAWFQVESSAEEEDSGSVIGEVSESAGGSFQCLNLRVESLAHGVCDPVFEI